MIQFWEKKLRYSSMFGMKDYEAYGFPQRRFAIIFHRIERRLRTYGLTLLDMAERLFEQEVFRMEEWFWVSLDGFTEPIGRFDASPSCSG